MNEFLIKKNGHNYELYDNNFNESNEKILEEFKEKELHKYDHLDEEKKKYLLEWDRKYKKFIDQNYGKLRHTINKNSLRITMVGLRKEKFGIDIIKNNKIKKFVLTQEILNGDLKEI